jgi:FkbM family methyltransferase
MLGRLPARPVTAAVSRLSALVPDQFYAGVVARTYRRYEPELRRLDDFCPRHGTALDVGAWYGPWSRALARRVDHVIAYEPNPAVATVLSRTAPPNVRVIQAAATDHVGAEELWVPDTGMGTEGVASLHQTEDAHPVSVRTTTIDSLNLTGITMIKLDVEGAELPALRGAKSTLDTCRPILLIELEYRHGPVGEVLAFLANLGYTAEILLGSQWVPLSTFDLATHQRETAPQVGGYLSRVLFGGPRYVNNVLFRPR